MKDNIGHVAKALHLPEDLIFNDPIITVYGQHMIMVENYVGLLRYTAEEISIQTKNYPITFSGKSLTITSYSCYSLQIEGEIDSLQMHV